MKKSVLMTGCGSSFGRHFYNAVKSAGHNIYGVGLNGPDDKWDFCAEESFPDVLDSRVSQVFVDFQRKYGNAPDILVLNSGIMLAEWLGDHPTSAVQKLMHVNFLVPYAFINAFVSLVREMVGELGDSVAPRRIVITGSMGVDIGLRGAHGYTCSKAALEMLNRNIAKELAGVLPISTIYVQPGSVNGTAMVDDVKNDLQRMRGLSPEEAQAKVATGTPMGRLMDMQEVITMLEFAAFYAPEYMSGSTLKAPGGSGLR